MQGVPSSRGSLQSLTGTYETILTLGKGGMGTVYLARMLGAAGFFRVVVLKRMHDHLLSNEEAVRRFVNEARLASHVHHANVVDIQHVGEDEEGFFLVLDYVEGDSLQGLVDRAAARGEELPLGALLRVVHDSLTGLHAVHEARDAGGRPLGVLHRDVSPHNLLVGRDGITRLTDFGVAKAVHDSVQTSTDRLVGKPLYMAPEYLRLEPVDRRIDVYAMGLSLWMCLTREEPWVGASDAQILAMALTVGIPPIHERRPDVPAPLAELIDRACAMDPDARFSSAKEMADALARAARESGHELATPEDVARTVQDLVGADLEERRRTIAALPAPWGEEIITSRRGHVLTPGSRPSLSGSRPSLSGRSSDAVGVPPADNTATRAQMPTLPVPADDAPTGRTRSRRARTRAIAMVAGIAGILAATVIILASTRKSAPGPVAVSEATAAPVPSISAPAASVSGRSAAEEPPSLDIGSLPSAKTKTPEPRKDRGKDGPSPPPSAAPTRPPPRDATRPATAPNHVSSSNPYR
jgi:eukaryotic-like serine/threonine-protein kinase